MPSIQEGLAMVQAEAMACSLPLICTRNTGGEELIENGKQGFIIDTHDVKALCEKIEWCFLNQDKCFQMGKSAFEKIQNFSWDHYGNKILDTYKKIISGENGSLYDKAN
jgi:glycosyltransferase involved in cell wall biosynthesis